MLEARAIERLFQSSIHATVVGDGHQGGATRLDQLGMSADDFTRVGEVLDEAKARDDVKAGPGKRGLPKVFLPKVGWQPQRIEQPPRGRETFPGVVQPRGVRLQFRGDPRQKLSRRTTD